MSVKSIYIAIRKLLGLEPEEEDLVKSISTIVDKLHARADVHEERGAEATYRATMLKNEAGAAYSKATSMRDRARRIEKAFA